MADERYRTVDGRGQSHLRVKGSRFIGWIAPVRNVDMAEAVIAEAADAYPDATHVVSAYRVRADPFREYQDDAGEPSGSAGPPLMSVLRGECLENVVAVVIRYYGGTNLGIGGLVRAYGTTIKRALAETEIIERVPHVTYTITSTYDDSGTIRSILDGSDATYDATYAAEVHFSVEAPYHTADSLLDRIRSATSGRADIE